MTQRDIWNKITTSLENSISESEINTWFSSTELLTINKDQALIEVPNKFVASWLSDNYMHKIQNSFRQNLHYLPEIRFILKGSDSTEDRVKSETRDKTIKNQLDQTLKLSNFIISKANRFAAVLASDVAERPAENYNPIYFYSKFHSGKTHLLNAIGNRFIFNNPLATVIYVSFGQLASAFSGALKNRNINTFRDDYRNSDIFLIDDIHLVAGLDTLQRELISIFNYYCENKKQLVVAGNSPPGEITGLLPGLKSRMEWGLLSELHIPDHKTRVKIIKEKAKEEKIFIPDDVVFYLSNSTNDLKELTNHLIRLGAYASLNKKEINISTVKAIIKKKRPFKGDITTVKKLTASYFNISVTNLLSNKKTHKFSYPRHIAMYLSRKLTGLSFKEIARAFGKKDHSTVIYAIKNINKKKNKEKSVMDDIKKLQDLFFQDAVSE